MANDTITCPERVEPETLSALRDELLPRAGERDACGRELYALWSQHFLGARIDLEETYDWGQQELARISDEMKTTAERIKPGAAPAAIPGPAEAA